MGSGDMASHVRGLPHSEASERSWAEPEAEEALARRSLQQQKKACDKQVADLTAKRDQLMLKLKQAEASTGAENGRPVAWSGPSKSPSERQQFEALSQRRDLLRARLRQAESEADKVVPDRVRKVFNQFDRNRSGFLDYRELRHALESAGINVGADSARRLLLQYDDRPNGKLDVGEFTKLAHDLEIGMA